MWLFNILHLANMWGSDLGFLPQICILANGDHWSIFISIPLPLLICWQFSEPFACWYLWNVQIYARWFAYWYLWNVVRDYCVHYKSLLGVDLSTVICFKDNIWCVCAYCVYLFFSSLASIWRYHWCGLWTVVMGFYTAMTPNHFHLWQKNIKTQQQTNFLHLWEMCFSIALLKFTTCTNFTNILFADFFTVQKSNSFHHHNVFYTANELLVSC
jgi:hypothetical protein